MGAERGHQAHALGDLAINWLATGSGGSRRELFKPLLHASILNSPKPGFQFLSVIIIGQRFHNIPLLSCLPRGLRVETNGGLSRCDPSPRLCWRQTTEYTEHTENLPANAFHGRIDHGFVHKTWFTRKSADDRHQKTRKISGR
jgi:hypothetical protein